VTRQAAAEEAFVHYQALLSDLRREDFERGDVLLRKHLVRLQAWLDARSRALKDHTKMRRKRQESWI